MRKKTDWADLAFQFLSFAAMCLVLSVSRLPFIAKIVLAFGLAVLLSAVWGYARRAWRRRRQEPRRIRVAIRNMDD